MKLPSFPHNVLYITRPHFHRLQQNGVDTPTTTSDSMAASVVKRQSSSTCSAGNNSPICQKPTDNASTQTLPIVLGAVIPISCAIIVFIFLHRRHLKKQRLEDANDRLKSLDFGLSNVGPSKMQKNRRGVPEMTVTDLSTAMRPAMRPRGLSMDVDSPYLLPAGLAGSRESIHSMSRSMADQHDPYRPVTFIKGVNDSMRSGGIRPVKDTASTYTSTSSNNDAMSAKLIANASSMSQSYPTRADSASPQPITSSDGLLRDMHSNNRSVPPSRKSSFDQHRKQLGGIQGSKPSQDYSGAIPQIREPEPEPEPEPELEQEPEPEPAAERAPPPPRKSFKSQRSPRVDSSKANAAFEQNHPPVSSKQGGNDFEATQIAMEQQQAHPAAVTGRYSIDAPAPANPQPVRPNLAQHMSYMGVRPLPPDIPEDSPEQRANRIRSFYKEYFDDSKPNQGSQYQRYGDYHEDYSAEYLRDSAIYDPNAGGFVMASPAYAQPIGRRAMTPPPGTVRRMSAAPRPRHNSSNSTGRVPRGFRPGQPPAMPQIRLPPPSPLQSLPTPHKLKDEATVYMPMDFAPRSTYRDHQLGRSPDSPLGFPRPYSPSVRAHVPLASSFDDLSVMPSPHALRRSGAFTGLDFAPPPRFKGQGDSASDAGSIRSNRSGISGVQRDAVRAGAYRVSRIPTGVVDTRDNVANQLKPTWDMRGKAL